ncbi:MAG: hypothetical protein AAGH19_08225 [Pseudomonadota bacterium]
MKRPDRETSVFSTSAIDLFASALGAFILLVMLLFPFYQNAGPQDAFSRTLDLVEQRRLSAGETEDLEAEQQRMEDELDELQDSNAQLELLIAQLQNDLRDVNRQISELPVPAPDEIEIPEPEPTFITDGVEFSILGLASESKSFVIVVDMSGSMINYQDLMIRSVLEILEPLDESNEFAIVGYQGAPAPVLWQFPGGDSLMKGTPENLRQAREFTRGLARKFVGSTPTHFAVQAAMEYPANAVILMSDGEPNNPPGFIIEDLSRRNQFRQTELHTVAIGDYTHNRNLVLFLQTLARLNNGDFVGVSR